MEFYDFTGAGQRPCRAVLGTFDGMHQGHLSLFSAAAACSERDGLALCAVVIEREKGERLTTIERRMDLIRQAGADFAYLFMLGEIKDLSCEAFADKLQRELSVRACVCGYNFRFGKDRAGSGDLLNDWLPTVIVPAVCMDGAAISSTKIKGLLKQGSPEQAAKLLGRGYSVRGVVKHGRGLGADFGFPTANLTFPPRAVLPAKGVYVTDVLADGCRMRAVTNVGTRPTVGGTQFRAESFLLDFTGDLYEKEIQVIFLTHLRDEMKFDSTEALCAQIRQDVEKARAY
ncbi:MAG: riboflavin biosynthesis protein RibF [Clostridiales bacterium]|nr:riboflavin biosynthesis protein RibF [Clostridiales bacterium]